MSNKTFEVYKKAVTENFRFLKSAENIRDAYLRAIPIGQKGFLVPVCKAHLEDSELIKNLTVWRNTNVDVYPTQFIATEQSTKAWVLDRLLVVDDRILFLVCDIKGKVLGHIGFNGCHDSELRFEIDNVSKGNDQSEEGLFSDAIVVLMEWARKTINVDSFILKVMDSDQKAIDFYEKNEFIEQKRLPLTKVIQGGSVNYVDAKPGEVPERHFIQMIWKPAREYVGKSLILTAGPSISSKEAVFAFDAASNGWNSNWSKYLTVFEKKFAEYVGVKYAMATSSCTGALQIALMALDIGPGDEVIVPDQTWVATANAVRYVGAIPVFADIELDTWNIDVRSIEKLITPKTKAIMPVHMYGHPARMTKIVELAKKHNLKIIEDAAPAIGAEWEGRRCGSFGDFAGFSFQGAKLMVTGEGGMLVTNSDELYEKALKIWDQGRNPSRTFWIDADGVKFKMSNIQAALGLAQLERVDELIEMKRRIFSWYQEGLSNTPNITLNQEVQGARSIYWMSSLRLDEGATVSRDELIKKLKEMNVDSRPVFPAISQYPIWPRHQDPQATAMRVGNQAINLPSGVCLTKDEVIYAAKAVEGILRG